MELRIINLEEVHAGQAIGVLCQAFEDDLLFKIAYGGEPLQRKYKIRRMFEITAKAALCGAGSMVGVLEAGQVIAVACLREPHSSDWPKTLADEFLEAVGPSAVEVFNRYHDLRARHVVQESHLYLVTLGVHPASQGKGVGTRLLEHLFRTAEATPGVAGVSLDTDSPRTMKFYESLGFKTVGDEVLDGLMIRFMFRPNT